MSQELIETLNRLLVGELAASHRCLAHAELCDERGYEKLLEAHERRAQEKMTHARALMGKLLSLHVRPLPTHEEPAAVDVDVGQQVRGDLLAAEASVADYRQGIAQATAAGDQGTRLMLEAILEQEQRHLDWLQREAERLEQLGLSAYLRSWC